MSCARPAAWRLCCLPDKPCLFSCPRMQDGWLCESRLSPARLAIQTAGQYHLHCSSTAHRAIIRPPTYFCQKCLSFASNSVGVSLKNRNGQDLIQGPFDPDQPAEEQETMRSGAFDASEKPVVGGKLSSSKIAVIGEGLAAKLKSASPLLEVVADSNKGPDGVHTNRFVVRNVRD